MQPFGIKQKFFRRLLLLPLALTLLISLPGPVSSMDYNNLSKILKQRRINRILELMSVEEKVGQLFLVYFKGPDLSPALCEMIARFRVGGILLYSNAGNIENPKQVAKLTSAAQKMASCQGQGIGLFVAVDQEGGPISRLREGFTVFPSNMAVAATGDEENARLAAKITAEELKTLGVNMNLAPVLDVNSNPENPIIGVRSFGSNPDTVARFGLAAMEQYRDSDVIAVAKHFPGHGDTSFDSHSKLPMVAHNIKRLEKIELYPFRQAIDQGKVDAIMTAHVEVPALEPRPKLPATLSANILTKLLRQKMGFGGLIVTDSLGMGALDINFGTTRAALRSFLAGADVLLFGADPEHEPVEQQRAYRKILAAVKSGQIPKARLDDSVRRILNLKMKYGLLEANPVSVKDAPLKTGTKEHQKIAESLAEKSVTLLRDKHGILPLSPSEPALVFWPKAPFDAPEAISRVNPKIEIIRLEKNPGSKAVSQAQEKAKDAKTVLVLTHRADRFPGQAALIKALYGPNLIVAAMDTPYDIAMFPLVPCYLAAYSNVPASMTALGRVLFGKAEPAGTLPVEIPGLFKLGAPKNGEQK